MKRLSFVSVMMVHTVCLYSSENVPQGRRASVPFLASLIEFRSNLLSPRRRTHSASSSSGCPQVVDSSTIRATRSHDGLPEIKRRPSISGVDVEQLYHEALQKLKDIKGRPEDEALLSIFYEAKKKLQKAAVKGYAPAARALIEHIYSNDYKTITPQEISEIQDWQETFFPFDQELRTLTFELRKKRVLSWVEHYKIVHTPTIAERLLGKFINQDSVFFKTMTEFDITMIASFKCEIDSLRQIEPDDTDILRLRAELHKTGVLLKHDEDTARECFERVREIETSLTVITPH